MIELKLYKPNYFLMPINDSLFGEYTLGFSLGDIFKVKGAGILTAADELLTNTNLDKLKQNIKLHLESEVSPFQGACLNKKEKDLNGEYKILSYRVFDNRHYYDSKMTEARRLELTKHESIEDNYYLSFLLISVSNEKFSDIIITKTVPESKILKGKDRVHSVPLYIKENSND